MPVYGVNSVWYNPANITTQETALATIQYYGSLGLPLERLKARHKGLRLILAPRKYRESIRRKTDISTSISESDVDRLRNKRGGREYTRGLVRIRDNYTCQDCGYHRTAQQVLEYNKRLASLKGRVKNLDVHHLNGLCGKMTLKYDSVADMGGLITLCHKCHYNRPEHKAKSTVWSTSRI